MNINTIKTTTDLRNTARSLAEHPSRPFDAFVLSGEEAYSQLLQDVYTPKYANTENMYALTPIGAFLSQLGGCAFEKETPAVRCAMGHIIYTYPQEMFNLAVGGSDEGSFYEAYKAVKEIIETGETKRLVTIDASASAFQILGANGADRKLLEMVIGTPCTPLEHFHRLPTDYYTEVTKEAQRLMDTYASEGQEVKQLLRDIPRKHYKNAITTKTYGKANPFGEIKGLEGDTLAIAAFSQAHSTMAPSANLWNDIVMGCDVSGIERISFSNPLHKTIFKRKGWNENDTSTLYGWDRTVPAAYLTPTSDGSAEITTAYKRAITMYDKYYESELALIANLVHGTDGSLVTYIGHVFTNAGITHSHKHDANKVPPQYLPIVNAITIDALIAMALERPLEAMLSEATKAPQTFPQIDLTGTIELLLTTHGVNG